MSVVVGAVVGDTVAIGCDSMSTWGNMRETPELVHGPKKLLAYNDSILGHVGGVADYYVLEDYLASGVDCEPWTSPRALFRFMNKFHSALREDYHYSPHSPDGGGFETSGYEILIANASGLYGVYPQRSVAQFKRFYAFGSGYEFAMGAMHHAHGKGESARLVVLAGLAAAIELDDSCGGPPVIHEIQLKK